MQSRLFRLCVATFAVAGFLTLSPRASAETINLDFNSGSNGNGLNGGGAFHWTQTAPINTNFGTSITTYCIDVQDTIKSGTNSFTVTSLSSAPTIANNGASVSAINSLFAQYYNTSLTSTTLEAAFQLALWDLVYGAKNPILTNYLKTVTGDNSTVTSDATKMLNGTFAATQPELTNFSLDALVDASGSSCGTNGRTQDQITVVQNVTPPPPSGVPAPPAVMLAGIGVLALFGRNRWTRRTTAAA